MASKSLTEADVERLQEYAKAGDSYDYWNMLAGFGDKYAQLYLQVVTGNTLAGFVADNYAAGFAPAGSALTM